MPIELIFQREKRPEGRTEEKGAFQLQDAIDGKPVTTRSGRPLQFVAFAEGARSHQQLVLLDPDSGSIETYWADGCYMRDREPSSLDVFTGRE